MSSPATFHSFSQSDGANPSAALIQASDGNLYGTAWGGGPKGGGVVFRLTHAPVAANDAYSTNLNTPRTVPAPGVLSNDVDVDHDNLTAIVVSTPAHGTLTLNANGSFTYAPAANYSGPDSFTYKANDGTADSNLATVSITVTAPVVTVDPSTFAFGNQLVGTTSAVQTVTLSNTGNGSLTINSIAVAGPNVGDFAQSGTCGSSLGPGGSCLINVTFTPAATGSRAATLRVSSNAVGSPSAAPLSGYGIAPAVSLSPTSLDFGNQTLGTTTAVKAVTLTNTGTTPLIFKKLTLEGVNATDFAQTNTCGRSVAPGAHCRISVTFIPTNTGTRKGTVWIADNAAGSPQTIALTGTGKLGQVALTPASLVFSSQLLGTTSVSQAVTVKNSGSSAVGLTKIAATHDFAVAGTTCGATLAGGTECLVRVVFTPTGVGARSGTLAVVDSVDSQTVALSGTGALVSGRR